jgi:hypothetical protein
MGRSNRVFSHHCLYYVVDIKNDGNLSFGYRNESRLQNGFLKNLEPELMLIECGNERNIKEDEKNLHMSFLDEYGSLPPFNSTGASFQEVAFCDFKPDIYDER